MKRRYPPSFTLLFLGTVCLFKGSSQGIPWAKKKSSGLLNPQLYTKLSGTDSTFLIFVSDSSILAKQWHCIKMMDKLVNLPRIVYSRAGAVCETEWFQGPPSFSSVCGNEMKTTLEILCRTVTLSWKTKIESTMQMLRFHISNLINYSLDNNIASLWTETERHEHQLYINFSFHMLVCV